MKNIVLGLALAAVATGSLSAVARPQQKDAQCCKSECALSKDFAGITLTEDQQGRLEALNNGYKLSQKELRENIKAAREKGDTVNVRQQVRDLRARYLQDVKEILGYDQYVEFLSNYYVNNAPQATPGMKARQEAGKISRDMKKDANKVGKEMRKDAKKVGKDARKVEKKVETAL